MDRFSFNELFSDNNMFDKYYGRNYSLFFYDLRAIETKTKKDIVIRNNGNEYYMLIDKDLFEHLFSDNRELIGDLHNSIAIHNKKYNYFNYLICIGVFFYFLNVFRIEMYHLLFDNIAFIWQLLGLTLVTLAFLSPVMHYLYVRVKKHNSFSSNQTAILLFTVKNKEYQKRLKEYKSRNSKGKLYNFFNKKFYGFRAPSFRPIGAVSVLVFIFFIYIPIVFGLILTVFSFRETVSLMGAAREIYPGLIEIQKTKYEFTDIEYFDDEYNLYDIKDCGAGFCAYNRSSIYYFDQELELVNEIKSSRFNGAESFMVWDHEEEFYLFFYAEEDKDGNAINFHTILINVVENEIIYEYIDPMDEDETILLITFAFYEEKLYLAGKIDQYGYIIEVEDGEIINDIMISNTLFREMTVIGEKIYLSSFTSGRSRLQEYDSDLNLVSKTDYMNAELYNLSKYNDYLVTNEGFFMYSVISVYQNSIDNSKQIDFTTFSERTDNENNFIYYGSNLSLFTEYNENLELINDGLRCTICDDRIMWDELVFTKRGNTLFGYSSKYGYVLEFNESSKIERFISDGTNYLTTPGLLVYAVVFTLTSVIMLVSNQNEYNNQKKFEQSIVDRDC